MFLNGHDPGFPQRKIGFYSKGVVAPNPVPRQNDQKWLEGWLD